MSELKRWTVMAKKVRITDGQGNERKMRGNWCESFFLPEDVDALAAEAMRLVVEKKVLTAALEAAERRAERERRHGIWAMRAYRRAPTRWAYERVCEARTKWQARAEALEAECREERAQRQMAEAEVARLREALRLVCDGNDLAAERGESIRNWPDSYAAKEARAALAQQAGGREEESHEANT